MTSCLITCLTPRDWLMFGYGFASAVLLIGLGWGLVARFGATHGDHEPDEKDLFI